MKLFNIGIICLLASSSLASARDFQARNCELIPVSVEFDSGKNYGRSSIYRLDTYSMTFEFKTHLPENQSSNSSLQVGFRSSSGDDFPAYFDDKKKSWLIELEYYDGGFLGYRERPIEGVFYLKSSRSNNLGDSGQDDYYWIQKKPFENMSLNPEVKLGPGSYYPIQTITTPELIMSQVNLFGCQL